MGRATTTDVLLSDLNAARGLSYPMVGYFYFADIKGDDDRNLQRRVWQIINEGGGVSFAHELNDRVPRRRCAKIRRAIVEAKQVGV